MDCIVYNHVGIGATMSHVITLMEHAKMAAMMNFLLEIKSEYFILHKLPHFGVRHQTLTFMLTRQDIFFIIKIIRKRVVFKKIILSMHYCIVGNPRLGKKSETDGGCPAMALLTFMEFIVQ